MKNRFLRIVPALGLGLVACASSPRITDLGVDATRVRSDGTRPLVVEWPSADRAELEALARRGPVAVRYDATGMRLLPSCLVEGRYVYSALTPKKDHITIRNADELRAQVPLGAAKLEGVLQRTGGLDVEMTIVGRFEVTSMAGARGDCSQATHFVSALTVGAFDFLAGTSSGNEVGATVVAPGVGGAGRQGTTREVLNHDGEVAACTRATAADRAPPYGCGAVMRVDLAAFGASSPGYPPQGPALVPPAAAPPGTRGTGTATTSAIVSSGGMVHIPAGTARIGADDLPNHALPVHDVSFAAFDIDVTEVTIRAYAECVENGPCTPPDAGTNIAKVQHENGCSHARDWFRDANNPPWNAAAITCVMPEQARQYCAYVHKRLPTEEEWEYAARGADFRRYPWGNADPTTSRVPPCHNRPTGQGQRCLAGTAPGDRSPFGVLDMAANQMEITIASSGYKVRGGYTGILGVGRDGARTAYRDDFDSMESSAQMTSFRCVSSAGPAPRL